QRRCGHEVFESGIDEIDVAPLGLFGGQQPAQLEQPPAGFGVAPVAGIGRTDRTRREAKRALAFRVPGVGGDEIGGVVVGQQVLDEGLAAAADLHCLVHCHLSRTTGLTSAPIPWISARNTSPSSRKRSRPKATACGVPVQITSPGSSVRPSDARSIRNGILCIIALVEPLWRSPRSFSSVSDI